MKTDVHGYNWFQRTYKGVSAGDVFSVPLEQGFAYGRVLNAHEGASIAEFFRFWSAESAFDPEIIKSPRLFSPVGILITDIASRQRKRAWKVVHQDSSFYPDDLYEIPFSQSWDGENWTYYTLLDDEKTLGKIDFEAIKSWEVASQLPQHKSRIQKMLETQLVAAGLFMTR